MTKKSADNSRRRLIASTVAFSLVAAGMTAATVTPAHAQQAVGNAPFINSWLVSGPFDAAEAEEIYDLEPNPRPVDGNWARVATAAASSVWTVEKAAFPGGTDDPNYVAARAIDGNPATEWASQMHNLGSAPSTWPAWDPAPTLTLTWGTPISVKEIEVFDRHNAGWPTGTSNVTQVDYTLKDGAGATIGTGSITGIDPSGANPGEVVLPAAVANVSRVDLAIVYDGTKNTANTGLGFKEVNVLDGLGVIEPEPGATITPELGEEFAGKEWEYFDDRLWNRNNDDYQDLAGYYEVKKGIDTRNKFVYAHSYVYSATAKSVQFRVGSSGSHRLFVNDVPVGTASVPAEVQKDMTTQAISLKAGWNKIMLQLEHTFTEDLDASGIPAAKDANVSYFGFYGRISDANGNAVSGLTYSAEGGGGALRVDTRPLAASDVVSDGSMGRGLPSNVLPVGYTEWPYVWNASKYGFHTRNVSASKFQLLASGGTPGYSWSIVSGALPNGLTLAADGTVDGFVNDDPGTYPITVRVQDGASASATKSLELVVEERPNQWFEEGRSSGLAHCVVVNPWWVDPNYSVDLWAQRAKDQGLSLVAVEAVQTNYYWPSKFDDPNHANNAYSPRDVNGEIVDGLKPFEVAVKRYGMKFGFYYAAEGGVFQHNSSDAFVQDVTDLIRRYDPDYFYFDGTAQMGPYNWDAMYSAIRNYSPDIVLNANWDYSFEFGDQDLRSRENGGIYSNAPDVQLNKRSTSEPWKPPVSALNGTSYYPKRDDYRQTSKEMIAGAGRGKLDNSDQMPLMGRGPNWNSPASIAEKYPMATQEFIDYRDEIVDWFSPAGKPDRHESVTGTVPYYLDGAGYTDDGKGNIAKFESGAGPNWGYAVSRDNNIYLHILTGPDGKTGLSGDSLTISPVTDTVTDASWLNEGESLDFVQTGDSVTIDLTGVKRDQVSTIVKLVTDSTERRYHLTEVAASAVQVSSGSLRVKAEGRMTYPALRVPLDPVTYVSGNTSIATVNSTGLVTAGSNGTTTITATGTYEGVTRSDSLDVKVVDGEIFVKDEMVAAALHVSGKEMYASVSSLDELDYSLEGRSAKGGQIGLDAAQITWKAGTVNYAAGTPTQPVVINESTSLIDIVDGKIVPAPVTVGTRIAVWAEVVLDGQAATSNKVFLQLQPTRNLATDATVTASASLGSSTPDRTIDGHRIEGASLDASRWSVSGSGASWISYELEEKSSITTVDVNFNSLDQGFVNTPSSMQIQTSNDGTTWQTVSTVTPPTLTTGAYFGYPNSYPVGEDARFVRLNFPNGGNADRLDVVEVAINGKPAVAADLAAHWKFDETSGASASDSSGNGFTAAVSGTPSWVTGVAGNAVSLDGSTEHADAALVSTRTDDLAFSGWVRSDGATATHQVLFYSGHTGSSGYGVYVNHSQGDKLAVLVGGVATVQSQTVLPVGQWVHVAAVRRSGVWKLYVDGTAVSVTNAGAVPRTPVGTTHVGGAQSGAFPFRGAIDDVRLYDGALSSSDIAYLHDHPGADVP